MVKFKQKYVTWSHSFVGFGPVAGPVAQLNPCTPINPCLNDGNCFLTLDGGHRCECADPLIHTGPNCEIGELLLSPFTLSQNFVSCFVTGVFPTPATNPPPPTTPPPPQPTTTFEPTTTTEMEVMVGDLGLPDMILVQSLVGPVNTGPTILDVFDLNPGSTSFSLLQVWSIFKTACTYVYVAPITERQWFFVDDDEE